MAERQWWIYQCQEPDCRTVIQLAAPAGREPEPQRVCGDCDGISTLQDPETFYIQRTRAEG